ncbi:MAG: response regulator transcription factor [Deltaproteobacteria bacterium]|nr:response regulator transcription factor [Deltaproteobacteria bacterium]
MPDRILLVDDNPRIRYRIRELLAQEYPDAEIVEAGSAEEASSLMAAGPFALVLLDVQLPGRSGIAALPDLRATQPSAPIVMVSGVPRDQYAPAALRAGARAFVAKERVHEDLAGVLRTLLP